MRSVYKRPCDIDLFGVAWTGVWTACWMRHGASCSCKMVRAEGIHKSIAKGGAEDIDAAVNSAQSALRTGWGRATALERGRLLNRLGQLVLENVDELARL